LKGENLAEAIIEVLDSLDAKDAVNELQEKIAISLACHGAVKAGQTLSQEEIRQLIRDLEATSLPRNCPHGRPTMVHLTSAQLEKEFGRR
jgi:DNA mismatch repair protein MutL